MNIDPFVKRIESLSPTQLVEEGKDAVKIISKYLLEEKGFDTHTAYILISNHCYYTIYEIGSLTQEVFVYWKRVFEFTDDKTTFLGKMRSTISPANRSLYTKMIDEATHVVGIALLMLSALTCASNGPITEKEKIFLSNLAADIK